VVWEAGKGASALKLREVEARFARTQSSAVMFTPSNVATVELSPFKRIGKGFKLRNGN
jgi:hypothetical protein